MKLVLRSAWEMQTILVGCSEKWKESAQGSTGSNGDIAAQREIAVFFLKAYSLK